VSFAYASDAPLRVLSAATGEPRAVLPPSNHPTGKVSGHQNSVAAAGYHSRSHEGNTAHDNRRHQPPTATVHASASTAASVVTLCAARRPPQRLLGLRVGHYTLRANVFHHPAHTGRYRTDSGNEQCCRLFSAPRPALVPPSGARPELSAASWLCPSRQMASVVVVVRPSTRMSGEPLPSRPPTPRPQRHPRCPVASPVPLGIATH